MNKNNPIGKLSYCTRNFSVCDYPKKVDRGVLSFDEGRADCWDIEKMSLYIESLLLRLPMNGITAFEKERRWKILDGHKRLGTLIRWLNDDLVLTGLNFLPINGLTFSSLPETYNRNGVLMRIIPLQVFNCKHGESITDEEEEEIARILNCLR